MNFVTRFQVDNSIQNKTDASGIIVSLKYYLAEYDLAFHVEIPNSGPGARFFCSWPLK
jgi:hypothetical protein